MKTKQVIVIRRDLKMRRGKEIAQACHASMAFLTRGGRIDVDNEFSDYGRTDYVFTNFTYSETNYREIRDWLENSFKKVVVYVETEDELLEIHKKAGALGLMSHLVTDSGLTEFRGVATNTCVAIGHAYEEKFVGLTDHLPLL